MKKLRPRIGALILLALLVIVSLWWVRERLLGQPEGAASPESSKPAAPTFNMVIVQQGQDRRDITHCQAETCQELVPPESDGAEAVTDSRWWYFFRDNAIRRQAIASDESQLIIEQTPLIKPRGLFMSPDNAKVAFWLDNIDEPEEQLTELWVFDEEAGGTRLLAEKISQAGVLSQPRWNKASTQLWLLGEGGTNGSEAELLLVSLTPPGIEAAFKQVNWRELAALAERGPMDISPDGGSLVYALPKTRRTSTLTVVTGDSAPKTTAVRGAVPFVQWLGDGSLFYATQDDRNVTFWRIQDGRHRRLAESKGQLQSLRADQAGTYALFAVQGEGQRVYIRSLNLESAAIADQTALASFGSSIHLVHVKPIVEESLPNIGRELDDAEIARFIEEHLQSIAASPAAQQKRLIITDKPNTVFVDFATSPGTLKRALVTIHDAIHPEWSVSTRFDERGGEWVITEGTQAQSPNPKRLYEWETSLKQWILKAEY